MYTAEEDFAYAQQERYSVLATPADAHREWHANAGVPMGTPGCPQDACHVDDLGYDEEDFVGPVIPAVKCGCGCGERVPVFVVKTHFEVLYAAKRGLSR